jgi:hypothetical protein
MGYVHDTEMVQQISPFQMVNTAGTWTPTVAANLVTNVRTAADTSFTTIIPITLPQNSGNQKGAFLKSVDVWYKVGVAALDDFATVTLSKNNLQASGTTVTGSAISTTPDGGHDTAAERKATGDHCMNVALDTPVWVGANDVCYLTLIVDAAATSTFAMIGARANFTLRV